MLHKNSVSNKVISVQNMSSSSIKCLMCLTCKMTKSQPSYIKIKKSEYKTMQLPPLEPTTIKRVKLSIPKHSPPIPESHSKDIVPTYPLSTHAKNSKSRVMPFSIDSLRSFPTPDAAHPPGEILHIDFSFYPSTSIYGFTSVLDVLCASTSYP